MPNVAICKDGERIEIRRIIYNDDSDISYYRTKSPFFCPHCLEKMTFKCGPEIRGHFAHGANQDRHCKAHDYYKNESEEHRQFKLIIQQFLIEKSSLNVVQEFSIAHRERIADLAIIDVNNNPLLAIEIQLSAISYEEFLERTNSYNINSVHVIWLLGEKNHKFIKNNENLLNNNLNEYDFFKIKTTEASHGTFQVELMTDDVIKNDWERKDKNFVFALICLEKSLIRLKKSNPKKSPAQLMHLLNHVDENRSNAYEIYFEGASFIPERKVTIWDLVHLNHRRKIHSLYREKIALEIERLSRNSQAEVENRIRKEKSSYFNRKNELENSFKIKENSMLDAERNFKQKEMNLARYEKELEAILTKRYISPELARLKAIELQIKEKEIIYDEVIEKGKTIREDLIRTLIDPEKEKLISEQKRYAKTKEEAQLDVIENLSKGNSRFSRLIDYHHQRMATEISTMREVIKKLNSDINSWDDFVYNYLHSRRGK